MIRKYALPVQCLLKSEMEIRNYFNITLWMHSIFNDYNQYLHACTELMPISKECVKNCLMQKTGPSGP